MYGNPVPLPNLNLAANIIPAIAILGSIAKFNSCQYFRLYSTNFINNITNNTIGTIAYNTHFTYNHKVVTTIPILPIYKILSAHIDVCFTLLCGETVGRTASLS